MSGQRPHAWIVEDSATLALLLTRQLQSLGYEVLRLSADAVLLPQPGVPAALCIALLGHDSNGFKLLRRLQRHQCPRVLLTASGRDTDLEWGLRAGATAVLRWPPTLMQLQHALVINGDAA